MVVVDDGAQILNSIETGVTPGRRLLAYVVSLPSYSAHEWIAGDSVLGGLPPSFEIGEAVLPDFLFLERELSGEVRGDAVSTGVWFEDVHTLPRAIDLGLVLSTVETLVEVFNAYRRTPQTFDSFTNNGGPGIDLLGETLPTIFAAFTGSGETLTVEVTTEGDPVVDSTLIFGWTIGNNTVTIEFTRVIPLATTRGLLIPEDRILEFLDSKTNVIEKATGREQRIKVRKNPRQLFEHQYKLNDELARSELEMKLAKNSHRLWAIGVWEHEVALAAAIAAGDTVISVGDTSFSDFRVGGTAAVFIEDGIFDLGALDAVGANSLTFSSAIENAYPAGARVVPMRACFIDQEIGGSRWPVNLSSLNLKFEVSDNDVDLADVSGFSSFNSKVLFDGYNYQGATAQEGLARQVTSIDSGSGLRYVDSQNLFARQTGMKTFLTKGRADAWALRGVLHALAGKLTSFYLPTFREDVELSQALVTGNDKLIIVWAGYTANMAGAQPKTSLRLVLLDGTTYDRNVLSTTEAVDKTTETLVLDASWPADIAIADVDRIMFLQKTRFDTDSVRLEHRRGGRVMRSAIPTRAVLQ